MITVRARSVKAVAGSFVGIRYWHVERAPLSFPGHPPVRERHHSWTSCFSKHEVACEPSGVSRARHECARPRRSRGTARGSSGSAPRARGRPGLGPRGAETATRSTRWRRRPAPGTRDHAVRPLARPHELESLDGSELVSRANQAAAFRRMSRSSRRTFTSRRRRRTSSRSWVVRPSARRPSSRSESSGRTARTVGRVPPANAPTARVR
jgi:hypothetical protein